MQPIENLRWENWQIEVKELDPDRVMNFYPFLWVKYVDLAKLHRNSIPVQEAWKLQLDIRDQLLDQS